MEPHFSQNFFKNAAPEYIEKKQTLFLDIRDFNEQIVANGGFMQFDVKFSSLNSNVKSLSFPPYQNVKHCELRAINFPKMNNDEMYFILDIDKINGRLDSSDNKGSHQMFAVIHYDHSGLSPGQMKPIKGSDFDRKIYTFNPIEQQVNTLSIAFRKYGGDVIHKDDIDSTLSIEQFLSKYPISIILEFCMVCH